MKAASFVWFVNGLNNTTEHGVWTMPACRIKGYQMSIAAGSLDWGFLQQSTYAVFDFDARISDNQSWPTNAKQIAQHIGSQRVLGTNQPPAVDPPPGGIVMDGALAAAYAIVEAPNEHAHQSIVVPYGGIDVDVPPNSYLLFQAGHSGGRGTFAVKMVLYYDDGSIS